MFDTSKRLAQTVSVLALTLAGFAVMPAMAQDTAPAAPTEAPAAEAAPAPAPSPDTVVATVGGETITEADVSFAAEDLQQELTQMPAEQRKPFLLRVLIDMKVMANAARAEGMDQDPVFQQRVGYLTDQALRRQYFGQAIASTVTPEAVQAKYDEFVSTFTPVDEIRASHILVKTKEEADAIKAELNGGADFATIAKEKSIDPGAANGGDLGFFGKGMMVAPFEAAAYALTDIGQVSDPVESQFGWHIIKLEERRQSAPPTIDAVGAQLQQQLLMSNFDTAVGKLMDGVTVEITDPALKAAVDAQTAAEDAAATEAPAAP